MKVVIKKKRSFRGLSLPENKITAEKSIEDMHIPEEITIPLEQNIGAPCELIVEKGEAVKAGQKIADSKGYVSAPIHSPISGKLLKMIKMVNPVTSKIMDAAVIKSDGEDSWVECEKLFDIKESDDYFSLKKIIDGLDKEEALKKIREAGVVGLGGATFPTQVKLKPPPEKKIDTIILNGCECEPFITSDHRIMLENGSKVLMGLYIISKLLSPENVYIGIEDNKKDAIENLEKLIVTMNLDNLFKIVSLKSRYPMGAEKTLIKTITGRAVPIGGLPMDVGVVVNNVATAQSIYEAVIEGRPLVERIVTVTGVVTNPKNLKVRIGTSIELLIEKCGGYRSEFNSIIAGGPMMGVSFAGTDFPVTKGTNCIIVKKRRLQDEQNCINCGRCIDACPMDLMPLVYVRNAKKKSFDTCKEYYINNCIECGSCAYVCPANIPIVGYIKTCKNELLKKQSSGK